MRAAIRSSLRPDRWRFTSQTSPHHPRARFDSLANTAKRPLCGQASSTETGIPRGERKLKARRVCPEDCDAFLTTRRGLEDPRDVHHHGQKKQARCCLTSMGEAAPLFQRRNPLHDAHLRLPGARTARQGVVGEHQASEDPTQVKTNLLLLPRSVCLSPQFSLQILPPGTEQRQQRQKKVEQVHKKGKTVKNSREALSLPPS